MHTVNDAQHMLCLLRLASDMNGNRQIVRAQFWWSFLKLLTLLGALVVEFKGVELFKLLAVSEFVERQRVIGEL